MDTIQGPRFGNVLRGFCASMLFSFCFVFIVCVSFFVRFVNVCLVGFCSLQNHKDDLMLLRHVFCFKASGATSETE